MLDRRLAPLFAVASLLTLGIIIFGTPSVFRSVFVPILSVNAAVDRSEKISGSPDLVLPPSYSAPVSDDLLGDATAVMFLTGNAWLTASDWTGGAVPTNAQ